MGKLSKKDKEVFQDILKKGILVGMSSQVTPLNRETQ
jgi:hypothetical protein